jgi:hypothetical protein
MRKPVSGTDTPINLDYDVVFLSYSLHFASFNLL